MVYVNGKPNDGSVLSNVIKPFKYASTLISISDIGLRYSKSCEVTFAAIHNSFKLVYKKPYFFLFLKKISSCVPRFKI